MAMLIHYFGNVLSIGKKENHIKFQTLGIVRGSHSVHI